MSGFSRPVLIGKRKNILYTTKCSIDGVFLIFVSTLDRCCRMKQWRWICCVLGRLTFHSVWSGSPTKVIHLPTTLIRGKHWMSKLNVLYPTCTKDLLPSYLLVRLHILAEMFTKWRGFTKQLQLHASFSPLPTKIVTNVSFYNHILPKDISD